MNVLSCKQIQFEIMKKNTRKFGPILSGKDVVRRLKELKAKGWKFKVFDRIQLKSPTGKSFCYCPITAIVKDDTGRFYNMNSYENAARSIKISPRVAEVVVNAADDCLSPWRRLRHALVSLRW